MARRVLLAVVASLFLVSNVFAYQVNDLGDGSDAVPGDNICATAGAVCTLRAAIEEANQHAGPDSVTFSVAGTITPASALPVVTHSLNILGGTAPGTITIDGSGAIGVGLEAAVVGEASTSFRSLEIIRFTTAGIRITGQSTAVQRCTIHQNNVGVEVTGGISIMIGFAGEGNAIFANTGDGILLTGSNGVDIRSNRIGIDFAGVTSANAGNGVKVVNGAQTRIGIAAEGNVISGNGVNGVYLTGTTQLTTINANSIGLDVAGTAAVPNQVNGILIDGTASATDIGNAARNFISGNKADGIRIDAGTNITVENNFIGLSTAGLAVGNAMGVSAYGGSSISIGVPSAGNVISGNVDNGIGFRGGAGSVQGNTIGLAEDGTTFAPNGLFGVEVFNSTASVTIGGPAAGEGNVISGNIFGGIGIFSSSNVNVGGNIVGLNSAGSDIRGNGANGISTNTASNLLIGGAIGRNIVSGNSTSGFDLTSTTASQVDGNFIGTDITGAVDLGNLEAGVAIGTDSTTIDVFNNVISGNDMYGVRLFGTAAANRVYANQIGLAAPNPVGVLIENNAANNEIGSVALGGNTIAFNTTEGVAIQGEGAGNTVVANSIRANGALGIDLRRDGVSANDFQDPDDIPNGMQNFPTPTIAVASATASSIQGTFNSTPSTAFDLHFYSNAAADPSGFGEGQTYLGTTAVTTDANGDAPFIFNGPALSVGEFVTGTATGAQGTSEFSQALAIIAAPTVQFNPAAYVVAEAAGTVTLTVTRTGDLSAESTVDYATSDGTAVAGNDYTTATGTITFAPGQASQTFAVTILDDTVFEPSQTFNVTLSNPTAASLGATPVASVQITDDDAQPQISIGDRSANEGDALTTPFAFTVSLSNASESTITVDVNTADQTATTLDSDYAALSTTVTFLAGETTHDVTVDVNGDTRFEADETFAVNLSNPTGATILDGQGIGTILNDDGQPVISIDDVSLSEGDAGTTAFTFTVSLSNASGSAITVDAATADGSATQPSDYTANSATLTFPADTLTTTFTVNVNGDTTLEPDEGFVVDLTNATGATIADTQGAGTIVNDDAVPTITIDDVTLNEGDAGTTAFTFTLSLSNASASAITVDAATTDAGAVAPGDYTANSATVTFPAGTLTATFTVNVNGDTATESDELFSVGLTNASGATIADAEGVGTIVNDDGVPTISIDDVTLSEGDAGTTAFTFTVTLSNPSASFISVNADAADGTAAMSLSDYTGGGATLMFPAGVTSQTFTVNVNGDTAFESDETFFVNLSGASGATIADNQGLGTIVNDDAVPTITIDDVSLSEGNSGTTAFTFTASLSNPSGSNVTVDLATADGSASQLSDYTANGATLTFVPNTLTATFTVHVNGDTMLEPDEGFVVNLTNATGATIADAQGAGAIVNDDGVPTISIDDVTLNEGDAGTGTFTFTVSLSNPSAAAITVDAATADGSASQPSDYTANSATLTFPAGTTTATFPVNVNGDTALELDENFFVNLTNAAGATIADPQGAGTIVNDDGLPSMTIDDVTLNEGNAGTTAFTFTVSLSNPSGSPITVDAATADASAVAPGDYTANGATLTFPAGTLTATFTVDVNGDTTVESNELFAVGLSNASGATIADNQGVGTIVNDDLAPASADLSMLKTASSPTFTDGQEITFTLTAANAGPDAATNVTITDVLPSGLSFVSATSADAACSGTTIVTCTIASLAVDQVATVTLVATASGTSEITNSASVSAGEADPAPADNVASATIAPAAAPPVAQIPTASEWALVMLMLALATAAVMRMGR